ncbi:hypothetical protein GCM10027082_26450 [Comamonas humi]
MNASTNKGGTGGLGGHGAIGTPRPLAGAFRRNNENEVPHLASMAAAQRHHASQSAETMTARQATRPLPRQTDAGGPWLKSMVTISAELGHAPAMEARNNGPAAQ